MALEGRMWHPTEEAKSTSARRAPSPRYKMELSGPYASGNMFPSLAAIWVFQFLELKQRVCSLRDEKPGDPRPAGTCPPATDGDGCVTAHPYRFPGVCRQDVNLQWTLQTTYPMVDQRRTCCSTFTISARSLKHLCEKRWDIRREPISSIRFVFLLDFGETSFFHFSVMKFMDFDSKGCRSTSQASTSSVCGGWTLACLHKPMDPMKSIGFCYAPSWKNTFAAFLTQRSWYFFSIIHFTRVFHHKASILGTPIFGNTQVCPKRRGSIHQGCDWDDQTQGGIWILRVFLMEWNG